MTRVAPYAQQQMILFNTLNQQRQMFDLQTQLSTGVVAQQYSGIYQSASRLVSTEATVGRTNQFIDNINTVEQRLSLMDISMESTETLATEMRKLLNASLDGPESHLADMVDLATNTLSLVGESLNARDGTRYLFAGGRVDRAPVTFAAGTYTPVKLIESDANTVDETFYQSYYTNVLGNTLPYAQGSFYQQIYFEKNGVLPTVPVPADLNNPTLAEFKAEDPNLFSYYVDRLNSSQMMANPKLDYYQGDNVQSAARIDESFEIKYGVSANEVAFQQLITAVDAIANLPQASIATPDGQVLVKKARDIIDNILGVDVTNGIDGLTDLRIELNGPRITLKNVQGRHEQYNIYAAEIIGDIQNINTAEVVARLQSDQVQLQASYSTISRIQSLSLLNFLN